MTLRPMSPVDVPEETPAPPRPFRERVSAWTCWLIAPIVLVASLTGVADNMDMWQKLLALLGLLWIVNETVLSIARLLRKYRRSAAGESKGFADE